MLPWVNAESMPLFLSPHSPAPNPVERLRKSLREDAVAHPVCKTPDRVEQSVAAVLVAFEAAAPPSCPTTEFGVANIYIFERALVLVRVRTCRLFP